MVIFCLTDNLDLVFRKRILSKLWSLATIPGNLLSDGVGSVAQFFQLFR